VTADRLAFDPDEVLYRTFAKDQIRNGAIKSNALRPQFSVHRGRFVPNAEAVPVHDKFTGVAAITVAEVRGIHGAYLTPRTVDEPTREHASHALIALTTEEPFGREGLDADFERVRAAIALAMKPARPAV
jgi:hypothetical protein